MSNRRRIFKTAPSPKPLPKALSMQDVCAGCGDGIRGVDGGCQRPFFHTTTSMMVCTDAKRHVLIDNAGFTMFARKE